MNSNVYAAWARSEVSLNTLKAEKEKAAGNEYRFAEFTGQAIFAKKLLNLLEGKSEHGA